MVNLTIDGKQISLDIKNELKEKGGGIWKT